MKFSLLPKTSAGKWAAGASIAFILLMALKTQAFLPLPSMAIFAIGLAGFVLSILAVIRKDHSLGVYFALLLGAAIFAWTVAEIVYPH